MGGGPAGMMLQGEKAKDFKGTMKRLLRYLGRHLPAVIAVMAMAAGSTIFMIFGPKILAGATDELFKGIMGKITGSGGGVDFGAIAQIMFKLIAFYLISAALSYVQGFIMSGVTMKVTRSLRRDINDKIHRLPFGFYDHTTHGEVLSRITNDVDTINQTMSQSLTQIITSLTSVIGFIVMMLTISWQMTLVALGIIPLSMILVISVVRKSQKHFKNQQNYLGHVNSQVEELYGSHVIVKAFNGEAAAVRAFDEQNEALYHAAWKANFLSGLMMPLANFVSNLGFVAICILGGWMAAKGNLSIGDVQAFVQYVRQFNQPISQVANISNVLQQTAAAAERVFDFLEEEDEIAETPGALSVNHGGGPDSDTLVSVSGNITFDDITFGYNAGQTVIHNFSAAIQSGKKVAIVGPTGAGKTTIVKLLMRFYDVNQGAIRVDGHDIRDFKRDELRSLFGMVLQDTWLFGGTIADNIRYGRLEATDEQVKAAAKAAQVDHFVRTLPDGYHMVLNEEASNVSGGQKQLLTIARAILADPQILILDEATSSVDTRTEILIQKAMDNLMRGRTSFVIAHRLSTIRNADLILVMREGDIVEQGKHEELLEKGGFYAQLYNSQFEDNS
ncbi:MAG: ABC transporter ATP-binding protein/permease [Oscillospiraceae bacterium]|nr:ABC transporter ATP-binding protein/permease [Oscillospiraceae bacterium]